MIKLLDAGSRFLCRSETLVYREARALREPGWQVLLGSLHRGFDLDNDAQLSQLAPEAHVAFSKALFRLPLAALSCLASKLRVFKDVLFKDARQGLAALCLANKLRREGVQHVQVHAHIAHSATGLSRYAALALKIQFSLTGLTRDLFVSSLRLQQKLAKAVDVVAICRWRQDSCGRMSPKTHRAPVIRSGEDVRQFAPAACKEAYGITIPTVGRLATRKGFDHLLHALDKLRQCGSRESLVRVAIVGGGPEKKRLEHLLADLGLEGRESLLGEQPDDSVRTLIREAEIFVLPCLEAGEGMPVVLMEAMAYGPLMISGDIAPILEPVQDQDAGLIMSVADHAALVSTPLALICDDDLQRLPGETGSAIVEAECSWVVNVERLIRFFKSIHEQGKSHAA